jgi:ribosomal-protein-serine acetyltransferase
LNKSIELVDAQVLLKPYRPGDASRLYEAVRESITELSQWMFWCHQDYSVAESWAWLESRADAWKKGNDYDFSINDPGDGQYLGGCGINRVDSINRVANLGYWVRSSRTGEGVATAATLLLARYCFNELLLNRIEIIVATGNRASQRVAEKVGAVREGVLRKRLVIRDSIHDVVMFSLVRGDFV